MLFDDRSDAGRRFAAERAWRVDDVGALAGRSLRGVRRDGERTRLLHRRHHGSLRRHQYGAAEPPPYLQDAHYPGARQLGRGEGYRYPHDYPGHRVEQEYRPARYEGRRYYEPSGEGEEALGDESAPDQPPGGSGQPKVPREPSQGKQA